MVDEADEPVLRLYAPPIELQVECVEGFVLDLVVDHFGIDYNLPARVEYLDYSHVVLNGALSLTFPLIYVP